MKEQEIRQVIFKLLKNIAPDTQPEQVKPDENIRQALGIDSFDYLQFIIGLDEELSIQTAEEDYGKIETLQTLIEYIAKKKN
jgi:acyl carrier protein